MKNKYDISIIIPVYNCAEYIDECLNSILKQTYPQEKIQVLCINDGSKDNSQEILEKYKSNPNFIIINKENSGVSDTRNTGIKLAEGKYLMYIDADDYISPDTCELIYNFFESNNTKTDVVVYERYRFESGTKNYKLLSRFKNYPGDGIYNLDEYYNLFNPTLNIATVNKFKNNIMFDTKFFFHEDEQYIAELVEDKKNIGFIKGPKYYYRDHALSTTSLKSKPLYCYEQYIKLYENFINKYTKNGKLERYIQYSIFNDIKWRTKSNAFFPMYLNDQEYKDEIKRIKKIFEYIEDEVIYLDNTLSIYWILYFLKNFKEGKLSAKIDNGIYYIYYNENLIFKNNNIEVMLYRFNKNENSLNISFSFKNPIKGLKKAELHQVVEYKDKKEDMLLDSKEICYFEISSQTKNIEEDYLDLTYNTKDLKSISYYVKFGDNIIPTSFIYSDKVPFNKSLHRTIIFDKGNVIAIKNIKGNKSSKFIGGQLENDIQSSSSSEKIEFREFNASTDFMPTIKTHLRMLKRSPYKYFQRITAKTQKNIFLYVDYDDKTEDAYTQFKYDCQKKDNIKRFYITTNQELIDNHSIINRNSKKAKKLYLESTKIIASHCTYNEYKNSSLNDNYCSDKFYHKVIFLNNKNLKIETYKNIRKFESEISKIIVSNNIEKQILIDNYLYKEEDILVTNSYSLDKMPKKNLKNKILLSFSWRNYLLKYIKKLDQFSSLFESSTYFQKIKELMTSEKLNNLLEKNNISLDLNISSRFENIIPYLKKYESSNIKIIEDYNLEEYKALITDFSNLETKYSLYNQPILYYLFDSQELNSSFHNFTKIQFNKKLILGDTAFDLEAMVSNLTSIIKNNFKLKKEYNKRIEDLNIKNKDCKEIIYNFIKDV